MTDKKIATKGKTRDLIAQNEFRIKKSLGQNFIIEPKIIAKIIAAADLSPSDIAVEIGPGMGALTEGLAESAGQVLAVEIDKNLVPILQRNFADYPNVTICHEDALKADFHALLSPVVARGDYQPGFVVVANLPYYITTPLIMNFVESDYPWRKMVLMVQKEVGERLRANCGTKDYGSLSIAVQYRAQVSIAMTVPPTVFVPQPAVDSAVVVLERLAQPAVAVGDEKQFFRIVRAGFGQRRKNLLNSLSNGLGLGKSIISKVLEQAGIESNRRGESLSMAEFALLSDTLDNLQRL